MSDLTVTPDGWLRTGTARYPCVLGKSGIKADKHEGDHATPAGRFPLRRVFYRADRLSAPETDLPRQALNPDSGWCDDPGDPAYNSLVALPYGASAEALYRADGLYDVIVVMGYNDDPPVPGRGSAIFLHVAAPDGTPTEGCVALALSDLLAILPMLGPTSTITIRPE